MQVSRGGKAGVAEAELEAPGARRGAGQEDQGAAEEAGGADLLQGGVCQGGEEEGGGGDRAPAGGDHRLEAGQVSQFFVAIFF